MFHATIIDEKDLQTDLNILPSKIWLRRVASRAGWMVPRFLIIRIDLEQSAKKKLKETSIDSQTLRNEVESFTTPILSKTIHCLLLHPRLIKGEIQRKFLNTTAFWDEFQGFINKLIQIGLPTGPTRSYIILTEVIEPRLSGISLLEGNREIVEVGFGQMLAKGIVKTSRYTLENGEILVQALELQENQILIKEGKKISKKISKVPELDSSILSRISIKTREFLNQAGGNFALEWFIDLHGNLYFIDAMQETSGSHYNDGITGKVRINFSENTEVIVKEDVLLISKGGGTGILDLVDEISDFNEVVDTHYIETIEFDKNTGKKHNGFIYLAEAPVISLEHLLPAARGFIFKRGSILSHFSNILRHHCTPGCIDKELYNRLIGKSGRIMTLYCGTQEQERDDEKYQKRMLLQEFQGKLLSPPLLLNRLEGESNPMNAINLGWKALNLNFLKKAGVGIPRTLIISSSITSSKNLGNYLDSNDFRESIQLHFPDFVEGKIMLICRSSASIEDGFTSCTAGLFESIPEISSFQQLKNAIRRVYGSIKSRRVERHSNIPLGEIKMGIIIQEWIEPSFGGVIFTSFPADLNENTRLLIELCLKSSEGVTSGKNEVYRCALRKNSTRSTIKNEIDGFLKANWLQEEIAPNQLIKLYQESLRLEKQAGVPLDIEFVVNKEGMINYVQSRHIM